jgi:Fe-S-cluster containining protein
MSQSVRSSHRLHYISSLKIDQRLFQPLFSDGCSIANCNAACCRHGVMVDMLEKKKILEHAPLIQRSMDPHQEKEPSRWFDDWEEEDADFPSGRCTGTQVRDYGCVFLNRAGQCVLQKSATASNMPKYALKPFFCAAYPMTLERGVLTIESPELANRPSCCSVVQSGALTSFEVCREELEFMLGSEAVETLKKEPRSTFGQ